MMNFEKKYSDSTLGVAKMLEESSSYNTSGATFRPDPFVRGVWEVSLADGRRVIAYLAGYPDSWGNIRKINDFEDDM